MERGLIFSNTKNFKTIHAKCFCLMIFQHYFTLFMVSIHRSKMDKVVRKN